MSKFDEILDLIKAERDRQNKKWGFPQHNSFAQWGNILTEELGEAIKELNEVDFGRKGAKDLKMELVQTAAVCVNFLEHMDFFNLPDEEIEL